MITDAATPGRDLDLRADVCVVGGGVSGGAAAVELARQGLSVVLLEAGGDPAPTEDELRTRERRLWQRGFHATLDRGIGVLQGQLLGGSFDTSGGEFWRAPDEILDGWADRSGASWLSRAEMTAGYDDVWGRLAPRKATPAGPAHPLRTGADALGWACADVPLAPRQAMVGDGAVPDGARCTARRAWIGAAAASRVAVLFHARAERLSLEEGRVRGVLGSVLEEGRAGARFRVAADAVISAAGALATPTLLLHSRVPDPHRLVGAGLRLQPAATAVGGFDEPVADGPGTAVTEFADGLGQDPRRALLRSCRWSAGLLAGMMPWYAGEDPGADRRATVTVTLRDRRGGRVVPTTIGGVPSLKYELAPGGRKALRHGLERAAEALLMAGAREVWTSHAAPTRITTTAELSAVRRAAYRSCDVVLYSTTPLGTCPLGERPRRSVADVEGRVRGLEALYVADASLLPSAPGVPLAATVAVVGRRVAQTVADDLSHAGT